MSIPPNALQRFIELPSPVLKREFELTAKGGLSDIQYELKNKEQTFLTTGHIFLNDERLSSDFQFNGWMPNHWMEELPKVNSSGGLSIQGTGFSVEEFVGDWKIEQSELRVDEYVIDAISIDGTLDKGSLSIPNVHIIHDLFTLDAEIGGHVETLMFDVSSDLVLHPVEQWQEEFGVPPIKGMLL